MIQDLFITEKQHIVKINNTLDLVARTLNDLDFAVVGSYARTVLDYKNNGRLFGDESDLDIALGKEYLESAALKLFSIPLFNDLLEVNDYGDPPVPLPEPDPNDKPKEPEKPKPKNALEYLLLSKTLTPIHLIGSYNNSTRDNSIMVDGIMYCLDKF